MRSWTIAQRAAEDERQRDGGEGEAIAQANHRYQHGNGCDAGESDQGPAHRVRRG